MTQTIAESTAKRQERILEMKVYADFLLQSRGLPTRKFTFVRAVKQEAIRRWFVTEETAFQYANAAVLLVWKERSWNL